MILSSDVACTREVIETVLPYLVTLFKRLVPIEYSSVFGAGLEHSKLNFKKFCSSLLPLFPRHANIPSKIIIWKAQGVPQ